MRHLLEKCPVIPVLVIERLEDAAPLAEALVAGGLEILEVTLRTPIALEALAAMRDAVPRATVGVGSVNTPAQMAAAADAKAAFAVSPGTTDALVEAAKRYGLPYLPGAATASEVMSLLERGLSALKFFPAEAAGGVPVLKSWRGPLSEVLFCPTGGITEQSAPSYLKLANVACVGGSWVTPRSAVAAKDWAAIQDLAARAASLSRS